MIKWLMVFTLWACPVFANDWQKLDGPGIEKTLTAGVLQYSDATQNFFADGRTLYEVQGPSWGRWQVQSNQYCSVWPPSDAWTCYDVEHHLDGLRLRFIDSRGGITEGKYIDPN